MLVPLTRSIEKHRHIAGFRGLRLLAALIDIGDLVLPPYSPSIHLLIEVQGTLNLQVRVMK